MIAVPVNFNSAGKLNEWYMLFENKSLEICRRYDAMNVWDKVVILKDDSKFQLGIVSIGSWDVNSNQYKAANEIVGTFEAMFGDQHF